MKCFMTGKECQYYRKGPVANQDVFFITPFAFPFGGIYKKDGGLGEWLLNEQLVTDVHRADQALQRGFIICQRVCKLIMESHYIVADASLENPNVYYELGLSYAMGKLPVICCNTRYSNANIGLLKNIGTVLEYQSLDDLCSPEMTGLFQEVKNRTSSPLIRPYQHFAAPEILLVLDESKSISGFHELVLKSALQGLRKKMAESTSDIQLEDWKFRTRTLREIQRDFEGFLRALSDCKVCIIDTTHYGKFNPNTYFYLGLAHGSDRDVIPITSSDIDASLPFDVRGLWHISYADDIALREQFAGIMEEINRNFQRERTEHPYRSLWNPFLESNQEVDILVCGRPAEGERSGRTNIDKQDYTTVAELSSFLAQLYPTTKIKIEEPKDKQEVTESTEDDKLSLLQQEVEQYLRERTASCIIVGSANVSDYAEIVLAAIHREVTAYTPAQSMDELKDRFTFIKIQQNAARMRSAFYGSEVPPVLYGNILLEGEGCVLWYGPDKPVDFPNERQPIDDTRERLKTYGVLTIASNPFRTRYGPVAGAKPPADPSFVMVLSGYTGIATYGLMKLISANLHDEAEGKWELSPGRQLEVLINSLLQSEYPFEHHENVAISVLVAVHYSRPIETAGDGRGVGHDHRKFERVEVEAIEMLRPNRLFIQLLTHPETTRPGDQQRG